MNTYATFSNYTTMVVLLLALVVGFLVTFAPNAYSAEVTTTLSGEFSQAVERLSSESLDLATTPFTLENGNVFLTIGAVAAVGLTYTFDSRIRENLQLSRSDNLSKATNIGSLMGDPFIHLGTAALVYGYGIADSSKKWKEAGEMLGEALVLADASTFILKESIGRGRPSITRTYNDFKPFQFKNDYDSFPSMHTASSFAFASVLSAMTESYSAKIGYYSAATFVGFSRMYKEKHWASDVVLGAILGELCGRIAIGYHTAGAQTRIAPYATPGIAGIMVVKSW